MDEELTKMVITTDAEDMIKKIFHSEKNDTDTILYFFVIFPSSFQGQFNFFDDTDEIPFFQRENFSFSSNAFYFAFPPSLQLSTQNFKVKISYNLSKKKKKKKKNVKKCKKKNLIKKILEKGSFMGLIYEIKKDMEYLEQKEVEKKMKALTEKWRKKEEKK